MKNIRDPRRTLQHALFVATSLALLPAVTAMAQTTTPSADEADRRELEIRLRQEEFNRERDARLRTQQEALRGQEEALQRLEQRHEESRRRLEESTREFAQLSSELGRNRYANTWGVVPLPRSMLGVSIDSTSGRRDGALVQQVSPGGAAAEAGIRSGDLIVSLAGTDLTSDSNPGRALIDKMGQVAPDTKVQVGVMRDGKRMNFDVTTRAPTAVPEMGHLLEQSRVLSDNIRNNVGNRLRIVSPEAGVMRVEPLGVMLGEAGRLGGMEFATISERLGGYFGVKSGVLVVRAGADAPFSLQDGDVILSVDGRTPTNAQHVGRILRSYQPGEKVKLRVQRDRKTLDLDVAAPGESKD